MAHMYKHRELAPSQSPAMDLAVTPVTPVMGAIAEAVIHTLIALQASDKVKTRLPAIGYEIAGHYNYEFCIRISVSRMDRKAFFAPSEPPPDPRRQKERKAA